LEGKKYQPSIRGNGRKNPGGKGQTKTAAGGQRGYALTLVKKKEKKKTRPCRREKNARTYSVSSTGLRGKSRFLEKKG